MVVRFFRLCRKPAQGAGRRYYRLLSYPQDRRDFASLAIAEAYAIQHRYEALLASGGQWQALTAKARQCLDWHNAGKGGYVNVL